jgi:hypothetical protein
LTKQVSAFSGLQHGQSSPDAGTPASALAACDIAKAADTGRTARLAASTRAQMSQRARIQ